MKKTEYKPKLAWTLQNGEGHEKERPRICHRLVWLKRHTTKCYVGSWVGLEKKRLVGKLLKFQYVLQFG